MSPSPDHLFRPFRTGLGTNRRPGLAVLLPLLLLFPTSCLDLNESTPVVIGERTYSIEDLRRVYADIDTGDRPPLATRDERVDFADRLIERELLREEGVKLLAGDAKSRESLQRSREDILIDRLRVIEAASDVVQPGEIEDAHFRMGWVHEVERTVFLDREAARREADRLRLGEPVPTDSVGPRESPRWTFPPEEVSWAPYPDPVADTAAGLEIGEVSDPIDGDGVWIVVRLVGRTSQEVPDLEAASTLIARGLQYRRQVESDRRLGRRLREEFGVRLDGDSVALLARRTFEAILADGATEHEEDWAIPRLRAEEGSIVVAEWHDGGAFTGADYRRDLLLIGRTQRPRAGPLEVAVQRFVEARVVRRLFLGEAIRRGLDQDWWVTRAVRNARDAHFIRGAVSHLEMGSSPAPSRVDSVAAILAASQPGLFFRDRSARVLRFDFRTQEAALVEMDRIARAGGASARLREVVRGDPTFDGDFRVFLLSPSGAGSSVASDLEEIVFEREVGTLGGPFPVGEAWSLVECLERMPDQSLEGDEIREEVVRLLSGQRSPQLVARWVRERRSVAGVRVDVEGLDPLAPGG